MEQLALLTSHKDGNNMMSECTAIIVSLCHPNRTVERENDEQFHCLPFHKPKAS